MNDFIKLFDATDKAFTSNGITTMKPLKLKETKKISLNGWFIDVEVDLKYKDFLEQDMLAVIKTKSKINPQAFRIDNLNYNKRTITFTAHHVMFDAHDYYLVDVKPTSMGAVGALNYVNERTDKTSPFSFTSDVNNSQTAYFLDRSLFYAMQVIAERWGGYYDADNWSVNLKNVIGVDRGDTISYGKNLEDIKVYENWSDVVTRVYPVGFDGLRLPEVYLQSEVQYEVPYTKRVDFETKFEEEDQTEENMLPELRANATEFINNNYLPKVSYEVVSNINQRLDIGDTVSVKHPLVSLVTEVQEYEYDVLKGRVVKLVFGNYVRDVKNKVGSIKDDIKKNGNQIQVAESKFQQIIGEQTDIINNMNKLGHVYQDDNQILILDKLPKEDAVNVWRWNLGGLAFSENGIEGPFKQAWTMDGTFNTAFIAANSILTNQLSSDVGSSLDISSNVAITQIVEQLANIDTTNNIIPNFNGYNGYVGWSWSGGSLKAVAGLTFMPNLRFNTNWVRRKVDTDAIYRIEFFTGGSAITPKGFVTGGEDYSYNTKIYSGVNNYVVKVREYNSVDGAIAKTTPFTIDVSIPNPTFTLQLAINTKYVDLEFVIPSSVTPTNVLSVTEQVFNKGQPGEFQFSVAEFVNKTESKIEQLSDSVTTTVTEVATLTSEVSQSQSQITQNANAISSVVTSVSTVDGKVNTNTSRITQNANAIGLKADKITLDGYVKFTALSSAGATTINGSNITTGTIQANRINFNGATGNNVNLTGHITATSGSIGNFNLNNSVLHITDTPYNYNMILGGTTDGGTRFPIYIGTKSTSENKFSVDNKGNTFVGEELDVRGLIYAEKGFKGNVPSSLQNGTNRRAFLQRLSNGTVGITSEQVLPISTSLAGSIGWASGRYSGIYLQSQPNVSSDTRYKSDIQDIDPLLIEIIGREVKPKQYRTIYDDKLHFGYIAQDVERALYKYCGNDKDKYAMLSKDESYMSLLYGELNVIIEAYNRLEIEKLKEKTWKNQNKLYKRIEIY